MGFQLHAFVDGSSESLKLLNWSRDYPAVDVQGKLLLCLSCFSSPRDSHSNPNIKYANPIDLSLSTRLLSIGDRFLTELPNFQVFLSRFGSLRVTARYYIPRGSPCIYPWHCAVGRKAKNWGNEEHYECSNIIY